jgi:hypothetical protein
MSRQPGSPITALAACLVAAVVAMSACAAPQHGCREEAPWKAQWTQPGLFRAVTPAAAGYAESPPTAGVPVNASYDRFGWGVSNYTVMAAEILLGATDRTFEFVAGHWDGTVRADVLANRTPHELEEKVAALNGALFHLNESELNVLQTSFAASKQVYDSDSFQVAQYRADAGKAPNFDTLFYVLQGYNAKRAPRGSLDPGQADYQIGPAWIVELALKAKTFGPAETRVTVDTKDRASLITAFPSPPSESQVRTTVRPVMVSAGVTDMTIIDLESKGTLTCG